MPRSWLPSVLQRCQFAGGEPCATSALGLNCKASKIASNCGNVNQGFCSLLLRSPAIPEIKTLN